MEEDYDELLDYGASESEEEQDNGPPVPVPVPVAEANEENTLNNIDVKEKTQGVVDEGEDEDEDEEDNFRRRGSPSKYNPRSRSEEDEKRNIRTREREVGLNVRTGSGRDQMREREYSRTRKRSLDRDDRRRFDYNDRNRGRNIHKRSRNERDPHGDVRGQGQYGYHQNQIHPQQHQHQWGYHSHAHRGNSNMHMNTLPPVHGYGYGHGHGSPTYGKRQQIPYNFHNNSGRMHQYHELPEERNQGSRQGADLYHTQPPSQFHAHNGGYYHEQGQKLIPSPVRSGVSVNEKQISRKPGGNTQKRMSTSAGWGQFSAAKTTSSSASNDVTVGCQSRNLNTNISESCTLMLTHLLATQNNKAKVSQHMSRYGEVKDVKFGGVDKETTAIVIFSTKTAAQRAFLSSVPIFNNKSILVYRLPDHTSAQQEEAEKYKVLSPNRIVNTKTSSDETIGGSFWGDSKVTAKVVKKPSTGIDSVVEKLPYSPIVKPKRETPETSSPSRKLSALYDLPDDDPVEQSTAPAKVGGGNRSWSRPGVLEKRQQDAIVEDKQVVKARLKERLARKQRALAKHKVDLCGKEILLQKAKLTSISKRGKANITASEKQEVMNKMTSLLIQLKHAESAMNAANKSFTAASKALELALASQRDKGKQGTKEKDSNVQDTEATQGNVGLSSGKVDLALDKTGKESEISSGNATAINGATSLSTTGGNNNDIDGSSSGKEPQKQIPIATGIDPKRMALLQEQLKKLQSTQKEHKPKVIDQ